MRHPWRTRYHAARKKLTGRIEGGWPSVPVASVTETVFETGACGLDVHPLPEAFPGQARVFVDQVTSEKTGERILRTTAPCSVDPKMGVLFSGHRVVWGTSDIPNRERGPYFFKHLKKPDAVLPSAILLHHFHSDNYYHFVFYVLTKAHLAEKAGLPPDIPFLVPEKAAKTQFFQRARDLGVFGDRQVIIQPARKVIGVGEAYLPRERFCDPDAMDWLCDRFAVPAVPAANRRLLVVRSADAANGRAWRNQDEVEALAARHGFEALDPGTLPLEGQAKAFSEAAVVVGAHGAGLTNLVFRRASAGGHLIELFSPLMGGAHYFMLARAKGFGYQSLFTQRPEGRDFRATTEVDCDALEAALAAL